MNIQITERDCELLQWINRCGFVTIDHVVQKLYLQPVTAYKRLQKLTANDYLEYQRIFSEAGIYHVTKRGAQISESPLPPLYTIPLATYRHDLLVTTLLLHLEKHWGGHTITQRELRHEQGFAAKTHISDGDFFLNNQRIAIEVELNKKSRFRRDKIFDFYLQAGHYKKVWYFYGDTSVRNQLQPYTEEASWLTLYDLNEILEHPEKLYVK